MARALVDWALARPEVTSITATGVAAGNRGSIRVLEKVGMRCTMRESDLLTWELRKP
jgi:RimJ/RimL family protein N-acetyltransferase